MTRITIATIFSLLVGGALPAAQDKPAAPAQTPAATPAKPPVPVPPDAKVGVVNLQRVIFESKFGQSGQSKLKALTEKRTAEVTALQKQIQTLQSELQTQASVLSTTVQQQKASELDRLQRQLQFEQEQATADIQLLTNQLMDEFGEKVLPIAEEIRKERGLWLIITVGQEQNIIALNEGLDLTLEIVQRLDGAVK
jgi:Skp family chaperone for outer membrane proteins